jgi:MerR family transcriptional regulator, thiopeptide resistance regulator
VEQSGGLRVGELARRCGVSVRALRYYDSIGLLSPARTTTGHRRYGEQEIRRLYGIVALRTLGVPLTASRPPSPATSI